MNIPYIYARKRNYLLAIFALFTLVISACGPTNSAITPPHPTPKVTQTVPTSTTKQAAPTAIETQADLSPVLPVQSSCPTGNTVRPMTTSLLAKTGTRQELIYNEAKNGQMALKRYENGTDTTTSIAQLPKDYVFSGAVISNDGAWVLFTLHKKSDISMVQLDMVRLDGQGFQSLYCGSISTGGFAWSPNMRWVAIKGFAMDGNSPVPLYLIDLQRGTIQTELTLPYGYLTPFRWLTNNQLYLVQPSVPLSSSPHSTPIIASVFLLNTNRGAHQQIKDLQTIAQIDFSTVDASTTHVFLNQGSRRCSLGGLSNCDSQHSHILAINAQGGAVQSIMTSKLIIEKISLINDKQILLLTKDSAASSDSAWLVNSDGTGLRQLTTQQSNFRLDSYASLGPGTSWSLVSRNGQFFVAGIQNDAKFYCVGSLQNGQVTTTTIPFGSIEEGNGTRIIGWTEM